MKSTFVGFVVLGLVAAVLAEAPAPVASTTDSQHALADVTVKINPTRKVWDPVLKKHVIKHVATVIGGNPIVSSLPTAPKTYTYHPKIVDESLLAKKSKVKIAAKVTKKAKKAKKAVPAGKPAAPGAKAKKAGKKTKAGKTKAFRQRVKKLFTQIELILKKLTVRVQKVENTTAKVVKSRKTKVPKVVKLYVKDKLTKLETKVMASVRTGLEGIRNTVDKHFQLLAKYIKKKLKTRKGRKGAKKIVAKIGGKKILGKKGANSTATVGKLLKKEQAVLKKINAVAAGEKKILKTVSEVKDKEKSLLSTTKAIQKGVNEVKKIDTRIEAKVDKLSAAPKKSLLEEREEDEDEDAAEDEDEAEDEEEEEEEDEDEEADEEEAEAEEKAEKEQREAEEAEN